MKSWYISLVLVIGFGLTAQLHAQTKETKGELAKYDFFLAPNLSFGTGDYEMGSIDDGSYNVFTFGFRGGFKLGGLLLGGEYNEGGVAGSSKRLDVNEADRIRYPKLDGARQQTWGWSLGFSKSRFLLWYTYLGYNKIKHSTEHAGTIYNHTYEGDGHRLEASFRVWKYLYLGAHYRLQTYDRYTSTHSADTAIDQPLTHELKTTDYGGTLSIVLPLSEVFEEIFKGKF